MDLREITHKFGGDTYANHTRASIPAPGHSKNDRSVSVFLHSNGQIRVHCFTDNSAWMNVLRDLREAKLINRDNFLTGYSSGSSDPIPIVSDRGRIEKAEQLWGLGRSVRNSLAETYLHRFRKIIRRFESPALRFAPDMPIRIYGGASTRGIPALLASISDLEGKQRAVELTYLDPDGARCRKLNIPRKTIGNTRPFQSVAVRLDPAYADMVVGEGIPTVLSASDHFQLPCWSLMSVDNFAKFVPPPGLKRLIIAGERDRTALRRGRELIEICAGYGVKATIEYPPASDNPKADWNDFMGGKPN